MKFLEKYRQITKKNSSYVCIGLDPHLNMMPESVLRHDNPIKAFNQAIVEATSGLAAAYKLNYAFYLASGRKGIEALEAAIEIIPENIPLILDVKAGDIANTMTHYAKGYFDYLKVDAITVNPLMGEDVITPLLPFEDKFFFVLALTSNPSASDFLKKGSLYKSLADKIDKWGSGQFGAVVGATNSSELDEVRKLMPNTLFLVPGIGAQGGSLQEVMSYAAGEKEPLLLINSSRGIIHKSKENNFSEAAREAADSLRKKINSLL